jgi:transcriptional regulator with XRE-family HTH domain
MRMPKPRHFLKEWRLHAKLSQEAAAERMGFERSYVSKVERGKRRYDEPFLEAAAKVYRCTPADLIGRHPQDKAA